MHGFLAAARYPPDPHPVEPLMASYSTNEFRSGLKIILDDDPYVIEEN